MRIASLACALALAACGTNNSGNGTSKDAREFVVRVENIAPWTLLKVSSQQVKTNTLMGTAAPGEIYEIRFTAGPGHSLMFATTLVEANDWFFALDPAGLPLYNNGTPISGDITNLVKLWDAGTELNQELGVGNATVLNQPSRDYGAPDPDNRVRLVTETTPAVASMIRVTLLPGTTVGQFVLRIENVSNDNTLQTSVGPKPIHIAPPVWTLSRNINTLFEADHAVPANGLGTYAETASPDLLTTTLRFERGVSTSLGRGVFLVHRDPGPLFIPESDDFGLGLEQLAEDSDESALLANLQSGDRDEAAVGALNTPVGMSSASIAAPGQAYEAHLKARPGDKLAIAMAFVASNDWFFGSPPEGIPLFLGDFPRWEDVTPDMRLFDVGTEADEELDVGLSTGVQQAMPNTGRKDGITSVREVTAERYSTLINQHIRVTLTPIEKIQ